TAAATSTLSHTTLFRSGWTQDNYAEKFLLFTEEIGELAKAIRKSRGLYQEQARQNTLNLEEEFADVLSYLLDLANYFQVDLEQRSEEHTSELQSRSDLV